MRSTKYRANSIRDIGSERTPSAWKFIIILVTIVAVIALVLATIAIVDSRRFGNQLREDQQDQLEHLAAEQKNDIYTVQYTLTYENLLAYYYSYYLTVFDSTAFTNAGYTSTEYDLMGVIRDQEISHVGALVNWLTNKGITPAPACTYTFNVETPNDFVALAGSLEKAAIAIYDGIANAVTDPDLQTLISEIDSVEAEHATFAMYINNQISFQDPFEAAGTPTDMIAAMNTFIVPGSCAYTFDSNNTPKKRTNLTIT
jgi:hypothetical protein